MIEIVVAEQSSQLIFDTWLLSSMSTQTVSAIRGLVLLGSIIVSTLLAFAAYFLARKRFYIPTHDRRALFNDLCRAHQLNKAQCHLLKRLSTVLELECPSALFIDSTAWKQPARAIDGSRLSNKEWQKLQTLQRILFMPASVKLNKPRGRV